MYRIRYIRLINKELYTCYSSTQYCLNNAEKLKNELIEKGVDVRNISIQKYNGSVWEFV